MKQVLSTKVSAAQAELFQESAEAQGESRASLLRHLVEEYLQSADKVDEQIPTSRPNQVAVLDKGHSEYLPHDPHQEQTRSLTSTAGLDNGLLGNAGVDRPLNPTPPSTSGQPVYHNAKPGRSATPPEQSSDIGCLMFWSLVVLILWSTPVDTAPRARKRLAEGIGAGICRQRYHS